MVLFSGGFNPISPGAAQHKLLEVSQLSLGKFLALEILVKYLKVTISYTQKLVKFLLILFLAAMSSSKSDVVTQFVCVFVRPLFSSFNVLEVSS